MLLFGVAPMPKPSYVAPSREGLVPLTVYVKPEIRQAPRSRPPSTTSRLPRSWRPPLPTH